VKKRREGRHPGTRHRHPPGRAFRGSWSRPMGQRSPHRCRAEAGHTARTSRGQKMPRNLDGGGSGASGSKPAANFSRPELMCGAGRSGRRVKDGGVAWSNCSQPMQAGRGGGTLKKSREKGHNRRPLCVTLAPRSIVCECPMGVASRAHLQPKCDSWYLHVGQDVDSCRPSSASFPPRYPASRIAPHSSPPRSPLFPLWRTLWRLGA
jgi:hypothetical protein